MKYKIILTDYLIPTRKPVDNKVIETEDRPYKVREIMAGIMLSPNQQHKGFRFYTFSVVAKRIKGWKEDFIILNEQDYGLLKTAFDNFVGFGPADTELVARVYEAEKVKEEI